MVPKGWKEKRVEEVCLQVSVGIVVQPAQYYIDSLNGVRAFRSANVRDGKVGNEDWVYISHEGNEKNKKSRLRAGDVLVVRSGYPGTACVLPKKYEGSNCIDIIFARPLKDYIIPEYLCAFTNSEHGRRQVLNTQGGLAQKHLNVKAYSKMRIPIPPLPEQKKIARILSAWDKAIETVEKLIENSQQQKKALMQQLLTGKKRLPGFSGEWSEYRLGEICTPKQWPTISFSQLDVSGYPVYGANGFIGYYHDFNHEEETVAVTCRGSTCGEIRMVPQKSYITGNSMSLDNFNKNICLPRFIYYLLKFRGTRDVISGSAQPQIIGNDLKKLKIQVPPLKEQEYLSDILFVYDSYVGNLLSNKDNLIRQKSALMQQLLTGKRRVRVDEDDRSSTSVE